MASQQFTTTTHFVYPTGKYDVNAGVSRLGRVALEMHHARAIHAAAGGANAVLSGFVLPTSGSASSRTITAGSALINGYYIASRSVWDGTTGDEFTVSFPYAKTYVWLRLILDASKYASGVVVECSDSGVSPGDAVLLGVVNTSGGSITSAVDTRPEGRRIFAYLPLTSTDVTDERPIQGRNEFRYTKTGGGTPYHVTVTFDKPFLKVPYISVDGTNVDFGGSGYKATYGCKFDVDSACVITVEG